MRAPKPAPAEPDQPQPSGGTVIIKGSNDKMGLHIERNPEHTPPEPSKPLATPGGKPIKGSNDTQGLRVAPSQRSAGSRTPGPSPERKGR